MKRTVAAVSAALLLSGAQVVQAQQLVYTVVVPAGQFGSANFMKEVLTSLSSVQAFCGGISDRSYRVDCLADQLQAVSAGIPEGTDYEEVRSVLRDTSTKLEKLVRANPANATPRISVSSAGESGLATSRPISAIQSAKLDQVSAEAEAILEEAKTILLRSAGTGQRQSQYVRIAQAIDSSKVLLRS